ncbi:MAG: hypothetical protein WC788_02230 [Candidatus Paceibacterota bacterium]|jgi:hypoxanthine phosphoribosyltransferase
MPYTEQYTREDFARITWGEYGQTLDSLFGKVYKYVRESGTKIDAVVPLLRGGNFPGTFLAFKLKMLRIVPMQYKYFFKDGKVQLRKILGFPEYVSFNHKPTFLLVENNHCFGQASQTAAKDLKEKFSDSKILYAADHMDFSYQKNNYADEIFYGKLTNETRTLDKLEAKKLGLSSDIHLFPWEEYDEEATKVQGKQYEYENMEEVIRNSEEKKLI